MSQRLGEFVRMLLDPFLVMLIVVMVLAIVLPLNAPALEGFRIAADVAIVVLFLVYGMRLPSSEVVDGLKNIKLQGSIMIATYVMFPVLGLLTFAATKPIIGHGMAQGVLFLTLLPSTVQSSVAFTSLARGNVPGAITGATFSNTVGIFITPLLVVLFMDVSSTGASTNGFKTILLMLLAPFIVGQILERWTGPWLRQRANITHQTDRTTILLIVFAAVGAASADGTLATLTVWSLFALIAISAAILTFALLITWFGGKALGIPWGDKVALLMCGSKKSLATGLPMSLVLFPAAAAASVALPLIIFHQLQLMVCAVLARRLAMSPNAPSVEPQS